MKAQLLSLAILAAQLTASLADSLPKIRSVSLCKARSAADRMMGFAESQSVADCIKEEGDAKEKLGTVWRTTSVTLRDRCKAEASILGTTSYLDLLTCIQMAPDVRSPSTAAKSAGRRVRSK